MLRCDFTWGDKYKRYWLKSVFITVCILVNVISLYIVDGFSSLAGLNYINVNLAGLNTLV